MALWLAMSLAWAAPSNLRLGVGAEGGMSVGGKVWFEADAIHNPGGAFVVGAQVGVHAWPFAHPEVMSERVQLTGVDLDVLLAPQVGYVLRLGDDRFTFGVYAFAGAVVRTQNTRLVDDAHDLDERVVHTAAFGVLGARLAFAVRLGPQLSLVIDGQLPLYLTGAPAWPLGWKVSSPTGGLGLRVDLPGRVSPGE